jgi:acyl-CoA synthetase (AMP-forming)/AMP-acid ligase II
MRHIHRLHSAKNARWSSVEALVSPTSSTGCDSYAAAAVSTALQIEVENLVEAIVHRAMDGVGLEPKSSTHEPTEEMPPAESSEQILARESLHSAKNASYDSGKAILDGGPLAVELREEATMCVHQLVKLQALEVPDKPAIVGLRRTLSYAQLWHEVEQLAAFIQSQTGKPEMHETVFGAPVRFPSVAILLPHCEEYILANLAIFESGSSMLLLEANYPQALVGDLLRETGVGLVLTQSALKKHLPTAVLEAEGIVVFCVEDLATESRGQTSGAWLDACAGLTLTPAHTGLDELAYITMTSGSTGKPKAIRNTHRAATLDFLARIQMFPYSDDETTEGLNMFFAWECLRPLLRARTAVIIPDERMFDVPAFLQFIREHSIHRFMISPSLLRTIVDFPGQDLGQAFEYTKYIYLQGEVLSGPTVTSLYERSEVQTLVNTELLNIYGTWECVNISYAHIHRGNYRELSAQLEAQSNGGTNAMPVGVPMPMVRVMLLDTEGKLVRRGTSVRGKDTGLMDEQDERKEAVVAMEGEIYIESPCNAVDYQHDPKKTARSFLPNPLRKLHKRHYWNRVYRSGDRGLIFAASPGTHSTTTGTTGTSSVERNHEGVGHRIGNRQYQPQLVVAGRLDDSINLRGFKVSLRMVERAISEVTPPSAPIPIPTCSVITSTPKQHLVTAISVHPVLDPSTGQPVAIVAYVVGSLGGRERATHSGWSTTGGPSDIGGARELLLYVKEALSVSLPEYARPTYFVPMAALPMGEGENRKLDKKKLPLPTQIHLVRTSKKAKMKSAAASSTSSNTRRNRGRISSDCTFDSEIREQSMVHWGVSLRIAESPISTITWGGDSYDSIYNDQWVGIHR